MQIERTFTDGNDKTVRVVVTIDEAGAALERAILRLANRARGSGKATALDGAVRVVVVEAPEASERARRKAAEGSEKR